MPFRLRDWSLRIQVPKWGALIVAPLVGLLLTGWSGAATPAAGSEPQTRHQVFRAGAATSNITPPIGLSIVGGWSPIPSTHVHDELHARCLALSDGATQVAIVICDNLGIPRDVLDEAKRRVRESVGLPIDHLLTAATHTHSSVSAYGPNRLQPIGRFNNYQEFLIVRIVDAVRTAIHRLEPAQIGWGMASEATQVFNRRWLMRPGDHLRNPFGSHDLVRMNPPRQSPDLIKPAGPTDPQIPFITVRAVGGRPIAVLANYSLHYVGGVERGAISADYFAIFADRIQRLLTADRLDPPFVGIMTNGTSGDINNINFQVPSAHLAPYEQMRRVAHLVAESVFKAHADVVYHDWVPVGAIQCELPLKVRRPTAGQMAWADALLARPDKATSSYEQRQQVYADRFKQLADAPAQVNIVLQVLRIGDVGIAAIPFETFVEIGLELKAKSPLPQSFVISLGNGSYGYLPTVRHFELGGYETWLGTNNVEPQAAPKIVQALLGLLNTLRSAG